MLRYTFGEVWDDPLKENFKFKFTIDHRFLLLRLHSCYQPQYV